MKDRRKFIHKLQRPLFRWDFFLIIAMLSGFIIGQASWFNEYLDKEMLDLIEEDSSVEVYKLWDERLKDLVR